MINPVRKTTLEIAQSAKNVKIDHEKIFELAEKMVKDNVYKPSWFLAVRLQTKNLERLAQYLILVDSLNFCFWSRAGDKWFITDRGKKYDGSYALALALKKWFLKNPKIDAFEYFSTISIKKFLNIFDGGKNLAFLHERRKIIRRVSRVMFKKYGSALALLKSSKGEVPQLVRNIANLPFFNDVVVAGNKKIHFLKRAQLLASDLMGALNKTKYGKFSNPEYLTAFADYKIPQILHHFGILKYSNKLKNKIFRRELIKFNSREELEIRCSTIWAIEYLRAALGSLGKNFYSHEVDWLLWTKYREVPLSAPYHLTKTIYY